MAVELFVVPMIGDGTRAVPYRARYSADPAVVRHGCIRYSKQDDCIVLLDAPQAYLDGVAAQPDAVRICTEAQLDNVLTAPQRTAVGNALEAREIPAGWLNAGDTWRVVIRTVCHIFFVNQRLEGTFAAPIHNQIETWLRAGGLAQVAGFESEPPASTPVLVRAQGRITLGLTFSQLPTAAQNYLLQVRDRQGWTNNELGLTAASTVRQIITAMGRQGVGVRRRLARHGLTLNSQWNTFPAALQDELREVVQTFGFDPVALGFSGASTLRQILKTFADQFAEHPVIIAGAVV
jgi:hypothetical protein